MARKKKKNNKESVARYTQLAVSERRSKVHAMRVAGRTLNEIKTELKISKATVCRDLDAIRAETERVVSESERLDHMANAKDRYDALEANAWEQYRNAVPGSPPAIKALDLIRVITGDRIKALKDTGYIRSETQQVEVQHTHRLSEVLTPQLKEEMSRLLLEQKLTQDLDQPVHESEILSLEPVEEDGNLVYEHIVEEGDESTG